MRAFLERVMLVIGLLAAGCESGTGPGPVGLAISATPSRLALPVDETVTVEAVVTNVSADTVWIPGGLPVVFLEVRDGTGGVVAFGRFEIMTLPAHPPRGLAPGESVVDRAPWTSRTPGAYQIRAAVPRVKDSPGDYAYSAPVSVVFTAR